MGPSPAGHGSSAAPMPLLRLQLSPLSVRKSTGMSSGSGSPLIALTGETEQSPVLVFVTTWAGQAEVAAVSIPIAQASATGARAFFFRGGAGDLGAAGILSFVVMRYWSRMEGEAGASCQRTAGFSPE